MSATTIPPAIFLLDRLAPDEDFTIRLVIPGVDNGYAVHLESKIKRATPEEAQTLTEAVWSLLTLTPLLEPEKI